MGNRNFICKSLFVFSVRSSSGIRFKMDINIIEYQIVSYKNVHNNLVHIKKQEMHESGRLTQKLNVQVDTYNVYFTLQNEKISEQISCVNCTLHVTNHFGKLNYIYTYV